MYLLRLYIYINTYTYHIQSSVPTPLQVGDRGELGMSGLEPALRNITAGGAASPVTGPPRLLHLLPWNSREFYRYRGSLTTPGCHEAVTWTVFTHTLRVTGAQVSRWQKICLHVWEAALQNHENQCRTQSLFRYDSTAAPTPILYKWSRCAVSDVSEKILYLPAV